MSFKNFDFKNILFIRNNPIYKDIRKERILIGSGNSSAYKKEATRKANTASKYFIPNTYTPIYLKKLGQVGQLYKSLKKKKSLCGNLANRLPNRKFPSVIYNTPFTGTCQSFFSSPSINWSALCGQTLFQKAHFKDGLFEKERKAKKISPKKQTQGEMKR